MFSNCRFINNTADGNNTYGGAIYARGNAPIIENCYFENNHATYGGALSINKIYDTRTNFIAGNVFYSNSAIEGGALYLNHSANSSSLPTTVFQNNTFVQNTASSSGGGAVVRFNENQIIFNNNLFRDNNALGDPDVYGAGHSILIIVDSNALDYPDIIFESNSIEGFDLIDDQFNDYVSYAKFIPFSFYNMELNYVAVNNIYNNPLLYDKYKIDYTSPCFDSGYLITENEDDYMYYSLSHDIDGNNRIVGRSIDIGAYEYNDICLLTGIEEIVLGNINPDSPKKYKFSIENISNNNSIDNITFDTSSNLSGLVEFNAERRNLPPNSMMNIELLFYPDKMYQSYNGTIYINSDDILNTNIIMPFYANTHIKEGWNWLSFANFNGALHDRELYNYLDPYGLIVSHMNDEAFYNGDWVFPNENLDSIYSKNLYKIKMNKISSQYDLNIPSTNCQTAITLLPGVDNWVGYWLNDSQNMRDAFGDNWSKVTSIKSSSWHYSSMVVTRDIAVPIPSSITHPLHKGRGYIVRVSEQISGFRWGDSGAIYSRPDAKSEVTMFDFEETADYIVMDVIDIGDEISEIAAFHGDRCIGSTAVIDNQAQLLLYFSDDKTIENEIRLEYASERKKQSIKNLHIYDFIQNEFVQTQKIHVNKVYNLISLRDPHQDNNVIVPLILYGNYPNPFNPETTISFNLPNKSDVQLEIYNIKGQKVKTIINERLTSGYHHTVWNGTNSLNKSVASGVYFYRLKTGEKELIKKMILLK